VHTSSELDSLLLIAARMRAEFHRPQDLWGYVEISG
jgi:hypothetical protein